jgi:hypothetical protein
VNRKNYGSIKRREEKTVFTSEPFRNKVIEIARGETYVRAKNHHDQIMEYLDEVGINFYTNYCVAFVYWCYQRTVEHFGYYYNPMLMTASTGELYRFAERHSLFVDNPKFGDIYISKKKNHTGLVIKYNGKASRTVEGNTFVLIDEDGDGERDDKLWGVHERKAKNLEEAHFIRL